MVHGRNAGPANILELAGPLHRPDFHYLAPAAAEGTWYPKSFLAPEEENQPGLSSALAVLDALVDGLARRGVPPERLILLGFSQGACLAATCAARFPRRFGGVVVLSGGLINPSGSAERSGAPLRGTPVFLGCSDVDGHVPRARVEESAAAFTRLGADVTMRIYPGMGHLVNDDEIAFIRDLMARVAGAP